MRSPLALISKSVNSQILKVAISCGILFSLLLEFSAIGDFLRSAEMGSTMFYWHWLYLFSGALIRLFFLKFLQNYHLKIAALIGIVELIAWIVVTGYLFSAIYFDTTWIMSNHANLGHVDEIILFIFCIAIIIGKPKSKLVLAIAIISAISPIFVGVEFVTRTNFHEYWRFLDPLPVILLIFLFYYEFKKIPKSNAEIIDETNYEA